jgi:hypothetical protein
MQRSTKVQFAQQQGFPKHQCEALASHGPRAMASIAATRAGGAHRRANIAGARLVGNLRRPMESAPEAIAQRWDVPRSAQAQGER